MAKRSRINISDLQAMEQAYGNKLNSGKVITTLAPFVFIMTAMATILYVNFWVSLVVFVLSVWFGFAFILPSEISVNYFRKGMTERENCLAILTQAINDKQNSIVKCLKIASEQATGEFKSQLDHLIVEMAIAAPHEEINAAFQKIIDIYSDDIPFAQYFEQLQTSYEKGTRDYRVFSSIAQNHSEIFEQEHRYLAKRNSWKTTVMVFVFVTFIPLITISQMLGFKKYVQTYAHSFIGISASTIFIVLFFFEMYRFYKYYYDESVTSLKKVKKTPKMGEHRNDKGVAERNEKKNSRRNKK